jgi:putative ABC transport system permease protein
MSIGIFSAQAARTINLNAEHEHRFIGGADLIFAEHWRDNRNSIMMGDAEELVFVEPSFERFTNFEETNAITRVMNRPLRTVQGRGRLASQWVNDAILLAIEPQSFGGFT